MADIEHSGSTAPRWWRTWRRLRARFRQRPSGTGIKYRAPQGEPMAMLDGIECPTCWGNGFLVKLIGPETGPDRLTCDRCGGTGRDHD